MGVGGGGGGLFCAAAVSSVRRNQEDLFLFPSFVQLSLVLVKQLVLFSNLLMNGAAPTTDTPTRVS